LADSILIIESSFLSNFHVHCCAVADNLESVGHATELPVCLSLLFDIITYNSPVRSAFKFVSIKSRGMHRQFLSCLLTILLLIVSWATELKF
jgi:hypothetical protein